MNGCALVSRCFVEWMDFLLGGKIGGYYETGDVFSSKNIYIYMDPKENIMGCFQILEI